jgi:ketosteroid isomerase-like protein
LIPKRLHLPLALSFLLLALAAGAAVHAEDPPPTPAADAASASLAQVERAFAGAFAARDLERFGAFLDEDAVFLGPAGSVLRGKAEILAGWKGYFDGEPPFSWYPTVSQVSGNLGLSQGPVLSPSGEWLANFSSVWQRQADGSWKIVFDGAPPCRNMAEGSSDASGPEPDQL